MSRAFLGALVHFDAATALAHPAGSTGYAVITIDGSRVRYNLTIWPATLPPPRGDQIRRTREGGAPSRDRLLGIIRDVGPPRARAPHIHP